LAADWVDDSARYGSTHQATRKRWEPVVEAGGATCVRCGLPILRGARWHLDQRDDRGGYLGPAHAKCNLRAAGRLGNRRMRERKALEAQREPPDFSTRNPSREW
jgi:hypothetical protein